VFLKVWFRRYGGISCKMVHWELVWVWVATEQNMSALHEIRVGFYDELKEWQ